MPVSSKTAAAIIQADPLAEWKARTAGTTKRHEFDAIASTLFDVLQRQIKTRGRTLRDVHVQVQEFVDRCPDPSSASCVWRDKHDTMRDDFKNSSGLRSEADPVEYLEEALDLFRTLDERITVLRKLMKDL